MKVSYEVNEERRGSVGRKCLSNGLASNRIRCSFDIDECGMKRSMEFMV